MTYLKGQRVTITATVKDKSGNLADGTVVTAKVRDPTGTITDVSASVSHLSTGSYSVDVTLTAGGQWYVRFETTGVVAAQETGLDVWEGEF